MSDGPSFLRRTFLGSSVLAAVGQYSRAVSAQERKSLEDYANDAGYIDRDGVFQAVQDRREGIITESLLNRVVRYWRSGEPVVEGSSANPSQLIKSHKNTLGNTSFALEIQEYKNSDGNTPTKELQFQWDNTNEQSQLSESSKQNNEVDVTQLFTQDRQHVDIQENNTRVNQASLQIDKGPVYIDGVDLLEQLLIGASLPFERSVSTDGETLSKYSITDHFRLPEASGHVIGDEQAYISELEIQWRTPDDELVEVDMSTDMNLSDSPDSGVNSTLSANTQSDSIESNHLWIPGHKHTLDVSIEDGGGVYLYPPDSAGFSTTEDFTRQYEDGSEVTLEATTGSGYTFDGWRGDFYTGKNEPSITVTVDEKVELTATFEEEIAEYDLDINTETGGTVEIDPPGSSARETPRSYKEGEEVTISANPEQDYDFAGWTGDIDSSKDDEKTVEVTMDEAKNITAKFEYDYDFRLNIDTSRGGEVKINPPGETKKEFEEYYDDGTEVTLTAESNSDYTFHEWSGDVPNYLDAHEKSISVYMEEAREITAEFEEEITEYELNVEAEGGGKVAVDPPDETFNDYTETYPDGEEVTLSALPDTGYKLDEWEGELASFARDNESIDITIDEDRSLTATFEEKTTEYELTLDTNGEGEIRIGSSGTPTEGTTESYQENTEVTLEADPDSGYKFKEWVGDVTYENRDQKEIFVTIDEAKEITATFEQRVAQTIEISDITANNASYSVGDTASITTELTNDADSSQVVEVNVELSPPEGEVPDRTDTKTIAANDTESLSPQWDLSGLATGQYDITVRVTVDSEFVTDKTKTNIFEVTESTGPVNVNIETVTAQGDPVDGARITLTPLDGGSDKSVVSSSGSAELRDVPPGEYDLTAESTQLNQELTFGLVVDGTSDLTRKITFQPTDAIYGTVLNGAGQQHIPEATVSIPELQETAETDAKGEFIFESDIPDGTYEFEITIGSDNTVVNESGVSTFNKTREVDIDRTVSFDIPVDLNQPENDTSELLSEEDELVSIVVRNLEKRDVLLPLEQQFITQYGFVKGIITGIQGFIQDILDLLFNLDDIPKMINSFIKLINLILDDPSVIFKLVSMMINDILEKQEQDNPFEKGTIDHQTFFGAWMLGYGGIKIAVSIIGTKGATKVSKVVKSSSKINKSVNALGKKVNNGDLPDSIGFKRRIRPCTTATSISSTSSNSCLTETDQLDQIEVHTLSQTANAPDLITALSVTTRKLKRDNGGSAPNLWKKIRDKEVNKSKGEIMEYIFSVRLRSPNKSPKLSNELPSAFEKYDVRPRVTTELKKGGDEIAIGQARIINPSSKEIIKDGDKIAEIEFDPILVARNKDGQLEISQVYEVKSGKRDTSRSAREDTKEHLDNIDKYVGQDGVKVGENNEIGGLSPEIFKNLDRSKVSTVGPKGKDFDLELDFTAVEIEKTIEFVKDNLDIYKRLREVDI